MQALIFHTQKQL